MKRTLSITKKELNSYFGSPMALIFVGVFLAATLFTFFWVDAFFARGIADVRPMFRWMPILMIFLVAALTMRQWSIEQESGTLEILLTLPTRFTELIVGKFLAVIILIAVTLALTLILPIIVSLLGTLDWGPVIGGYLAAILMAAAYVAVGLFISSRTDNQIVALILTVLVNGLFYLVGSSVFTNFVGGPVGDIMRAFGTGSRFESIERGVIDLRDLIYYLSLTVMFLTFNIISLDSKRWSEGERTAHYRRNLIISAALVALNLIVLNVWVFPFWQARLDLTAQNRYSLSQTTRDLVGNLQEPLLIRGYFTEESHPLLAPLVPQISDMLQEYRIASDGKVTVEMVNPLKEPEKEAEANQTYGIQPTPLRSADKYGASVVNAYFDILIRYGDQHEVLHFTDLIEVDPYYSGQVDVRLRNLEYDLTRAIKKVVYGFQSVDAVLAAMDQPVKLTLYHTPDTLPEWMANAPETIQQVAQEIAEESDGKFTYESVNVDAPDSPVTREMMLEQYGLRPIAVSLFSSESYYLHMILQIGNQSQLLYPSGELNEADIRATIEAALKRGAPGFLKVVGVWKPPETPTQDMFGQQQPSFKQYNAVVSQLREDYTVKSVDLQNGQVPADVDVLLVISPQGLTDKQRYAIDQYLMRGGSVIVAAGNYNLNPDPFTGNLGVIEVEESLQEMLASYGIEVQKSLVLDPQNEPFPIQVARDVGGFQVREIQAINYPFFVDVRSDGMANDSPVLTNLPAVTMNWVSPLNIDEEKNAERELTVLLKSTPNSWTSTNTNIQPDLETYPEMGFPVGEERQSYPLAVSVRGVFESYFKDKPSPFAEPEEGEEAAETPPEVEQVGTIEVSPETARLVVIGSAEFLNDIVFDLSANLTRDRYMNSLQFTQNAVDWAVEDLDLLNIRSRGSSVYPLKPIGERQQTIWEAVSYIWAILAVVIIGFLWYTQRKSEEPMELAPRAGSRLATES